MLIFCSWKLLWPVLTKRRSRYCLRASLGASVWWGLRQNPVLVSHMGKNIRATSGTGGSSHRKTWSIMSFTRTPHHISASSAIHVLTRSWILYGVLERRERKVLRTVGREPPDRKTCIFIFPGAILQPCVEKLRCKSFCPVSEQVPSCKDANSIG